MARKHIEPGNTKRIYEMEEHLKTDEYSLGLHSAAEAHCGLSSETVGHSGSLADYDPSDKPWIPR
jgi:hypothetical protein